MPVQTGSLEGASQSVDVGESGWGGGWGSGIHYSLNIYSIFHLIKILGYSSK